MATLAITELAPSRVAEAVPGRKKLYHLQALRGVAASLVVVSHSVEALTQRHLLSDAGTQWLGSSGYFGVATFFIISGFIIYKTSRGSFGNLRGAAIFGTKRFIRIFPIYWIATALFVVLNPHLREFSGGDISFSFILIPHLVQFSGNMHPLLGQGWTLQYEVLFYAIFGIGLFFNRRAGVAVIVAGLILLAAVGAWIMPLTDLSEPLTLARYWTRPIILLFAVGIGLGLLEERGRLRMSIPYPFVLILALMASWFAFTWTSGMLGWDQQRFPTVLMIWLLCALSVFVSIYGRSGEGGFEKGAEAFGDASYSVYLFHTFVLSILLRLGVEKISPAVLIVAALVGSNLVGYALYRLVERPILTTGRRVLLNGA